MDPSDPNGVPDPSSPAPRPDAQARKPRRPASEFTVFCAFDVATHPTASISENLARRMVDISEGGFCFESIDSVPQPAALNIVIAHAASGEVLHARGNVVWSAPRIVNGVTAQFVGVQFDKIYTPAARRARFFGEEERKTPAPGPAPAAAHLATSRRLKERFQIEEHVVEIAPVVPFWVLKKPANVALSVCDLSASGAQVRCSHRVAVKTRVRFILHITKFEDRFESEAEVVWIRALGPTFGNTWHVGVRFVGLSHSQMRHLSSMTRWFTSVESRRRLPR